MYEYRIVRCSGLTSSVAWQAAGGDAQALSGALGGLPPVAAREALLLGRPSAPGALAAYLQQHAPAPAPAGALPYPTLPCPLTLIRSRCAR